MNTTAKTVATPAPQKTPGPGSPAERLTTFYTMLEERTEDLKTMLIGTNTSVNFFKQVLITALKETPGLLECSTASIWSAATRAAREGLLPDGRDGKIIVRNVYDKAKKDWVKTAGWQDMIGGIRKKIRRSKEVLSFTVDVAYANDVKFAYAKGDNPFIEHIPTREKNHGPIIAAYAIAKLVNGETLREVMPAWEYLEIRDRYSDGWKSFKAGKIKDTPWNSAEGEMAKKTVARRLAKILPMDTDIKLSIEHDDDDVLPGSEDAPAVAAPRRPQLSDFTATDIETVTDARDGGDDYTPADGTDTSKMVDITPKEETKPAAEQKRPITADEAFGVAPSKAEAKTEPDTPFYNLRARLGKLPREAQLEVMATEVEPNRQSFKEEELSELAGLIKDE